MNVKAVLADELAQYGVPLGHIKTLNPDTPDALAYGDVIRDPWLASHVEAVVEDERRPLLYVVQAATLTTNDLLREQEIHELASRLACRGNVSYLGVVNFGQLVIYPCQLSSQPITEAFVTIYADQADAFSTFQTLLQGHQPVMPDQSGRAEWSFHQVSDTLRVILLDVCERLLSLNVYGRHIPATDEVLALVGRAVFMRFLSDRKIVNPNSFPELYERFGGPESAFDTAAAAALTCVWLNSTFNGELLPLPVKDRRYDIYFHELVDAQPAALIPLGQIMRKEVKSGMTSLWPLIDFAHVPAGLLSEVYEAFVTRYASATAKSTSVRYTPQHVAETVVVQAFNGLPRESRHLAKVADPASGAGVFLVTTLRHLVELHWRETNVRPDAKQIRRILYEQLRGFDINRHALILAALSLYLTVIELDPAPKTSDLPFEQNLIGTVLQDVSSKSGSNYGTLSPDLPSHFLHQFDLIVGNPPWTEWSGEEGKKQVRNATQIARQVIIDRLAEKPKGVQQYKVPDTYSDIPFVWRAMQLAKPGGIIALLVHAHLLFGSHTRETRLWLAQTLRVHGLLNLSSFSDESELWVIRQPFVMLFARNEVPRGSDRFWYISPYLDLPLAQRGRIRIDPTQAHMLTHDQLATESELLRILYRGSTLDLNVIQQLDEQLNEPPSSPNHLIRLKAYWEEKDLAITHRVGYKIGNGKEDASALVNSRGVDFTTQNAGKFKKAYSVPVALLPEFAHDWLERPRSLNEYRPPLVLVAEAQKKDFTRPRALIALGNRHVIFNGSFVGFSTAGLPDAEGLARYLLLIFNSDFALYYLLMTSPHFGVTRRRINAQDLYDLPLMDYYQLNESDRAEIETLTNSMIEHGQSPELQANLNMLVNRLYRLDSWQQQVMRDTLDMQLPYQSVINAAQNKPTPTQQRAFLTELARLVEGTSVKLKRPVRVYGPTQQGEAWLSFEVRRDQQDTVPIGLRQAARLVADDVGASHVHYVLQKGSAIQVDILAQSRYWTLTRAKLLAGQIMKWMA